MSALITFFNIKDIAVKARLRLQFGKSAGITCVRTNVKDFLLSDLKHHVARQEKNVASQVFMKILCFSSDLVRRKENGDRQVAAVKLSCIQTAKCLAAQSADLFLHN